MKNRTVRVIVILVGMLILNIEAAHAGITHRVKVLIRHEFTDFQLFYVLGGGLALGLLSYIIFTPAFKDAGRKGENYFRTYGSESYGSKRLRIKKIEQILRNNDPLSPV